jgi:hypothetical protein
VHRTNCYGSDTPQESLWCVHTARARAAETHGVLPVCTDICSTDTVANRSGTWLRLIALLGLGLGLVEPSTFMETRVAEHDQGPEQYACTLTDNTAPSWIRIRKPLHVGAP